MAVVGIFKFMGTRKTGLVLKKSQVWWLTPLIPALKRLRQEDCYEFEASLGYIKRSKPARAT